MKLPVRVCWPLLLWAAAHAIATTTGLAPNPVSQRAAATAATPQNAAAAPKELLPCPSTHWPDEATFRAAGIFCENDEEEEEESSFSLPIPEPRSVSFVKTIEYPGSNGANPDDECEWIQNHAASIAEALHRHGAVWLRGLSASTTKPGFRRVCEALAPMHACEDALASIGVRSLSSAKDGIYAAVDQDSMAGTFIGLHNDCTHGLAPEYAAFGCLTPATGGGGAFLLADGREILRNLDPSRLGKLCRRGVRVRVAGVPTPFLRESKRPSDDLPARAISLVRSLAGTLLESIAGFVIGAKFPDLGLDVAYSEDRSVLQIFEPRKSPLNTHPVDGHWTFFSGLHSQSAYLQHQRAIERHSGSDSDDETATTSFVQNTGNTDVFYGEAAAHEGLENLETIEPCVLDHIAEVLEDHTVEVCMKAGDVVLLDSYQVLHGRTTFAGVREHAVVWLAYHNHHGGDDAAAVARKNDASGSP